MGYNELEANKLNFQNLANATVAVLPNDHIMYRQSEVFPNGLSALSRIYGDDKLYPIGPEVNKQNLMTNYISVGNTIIAQAFPEEITEMLENEGYQVITSSMIAKEQNRKEVDFSLQIDGGARCATLPMGNN